MKNLLFFPLLAAVLIVGCSTVPVTGRQQLNLIPDSEILAMSFQEYDAFLQQNKRSTDAPKSAMVKRVGVRIQKAVETYFAQKGLTGELSGYKWEFNLVEDPQVNAWCMPGGKVVVYTGILPLTQNEAGLAVVMGHEIAHAIAEHGNERMSQALLAQAGGVALSVAMKEEPDRNAKHVACRLWDRGPGRRPPSLQSNAGERSRPPGAGIHGDGGIRSAGGAGVLEAYVSQGGRETARVLEHTPSR